MDKKEYYTHKIKSTYKCRINAAERLKSTERIIQFFNIYYSAIIAIYSIYSLVLPTHASKISVMTTAASILLLIFTTFLSSKKYGERARELKNNYIALGELCENIIFCADDEVEKIGRQYFKLLNDSENHTETDYCKALLESHQASTCQVLKYILYELIKYVLIIVAFVLPFVLEQISKAIESLL